MRILKKLGADEYDKNTFSKKHKILKEIIEKCGNIYNGIKKF